MALPGSGALSINSIATEFGGSAPHSLSEYYRGGAYVTSNNTNVPTSGQISISNFYGAVKAFIFNATISANTYNYNIRSAAISAGWNQVMPLLATITINSGIYVGSTSTGSYAFQTGSTMPAGSSLLLYNYGVIIGMGGSGGGGSGCASNNPVAGGAGGYSLGAATAITIYNYGSVLGGGGGGGGGGRASELGGKTCLYYGGSGGGGGRGYYYAGAAGAAGSTSCHLNGNIGNAGTSTSGGSGGVSNGKGGAGGAGGGGGSAGGTGGTGTGTACAFANGAGAGGGAAGYAVVGNAYITWAVSGTIAGSIA